MMLAEGEQGEGSQRTQDAQASHLLLEQKSLLSTAY